MVCALTAGWPCWRTSICAKEQVSPTPTTSTVKFRKKSMISRDLRRKQKIRMKGVMTGLNSSSRINTYEDRYQKTITMKLCFRNACYWLCCEQIIHAGFICKIIDHFIFYKNTETADGTWEFPKIFAILIWHMSLSLHHLQPCTERAARTRLWSHNGGHYPANDQACNGCVPRSL